MKKSNILFFLIIILTGFLWVVLYFQTQYKVFLKKKLNINITVDKWDNSKKIAKKICEKLNNDCLNLKTYLYFHKYNKIIPWNYVFSWENLKKIFEQFAKWPKIEYKKITILPWWTKFDIKTYLDEKTENDKIPERFVNMINDKQFIYKLKKQYPFLNDFWDISSLEGFIYPDTYFFKKQDLKSTLFPELLIKTSLKNFWEKYMKLKKICKENKNCNPYKLSNYEVLILSSIIEKEEKSDKNKSLVADVFLKRYKNHWKLWADWTLCYGLKVDSKSCQKYMWNKYLKDKTNKYNTRAVLWLPPTPVWNPTIKSIESVLFPSKNNYWYYLHDRNGKIHFAKNANEHNVNKNIYLK